MKTSDLSSYYSMASKDTDDPMEFLKQMRGKIDAIKSVSNSNQEEAAVLANARERMDRIDALLAEPIHESKPTMPPPGLSPQEEVDWWNRKIASLSGTVSAQADPKPVASESLSAKSAYKYSSKPDYGNTLDAKSRGSE